MTAADRKIIAHRLTEAKRVVVKVGSTLLVDGEKGRLNRAWLEGFAEDVVSLRKRGQDVILVSSGAIALGRRHLGLNSGKLKLEESQAAAAVGQIRLAHAYKELLDAHEITVAQVLLTLGDTEQRRRYLNARSTLNTLLALGAVPGSPAKFDPEYRPASGQVIDLYVLWRDEQGKKHQVRAQDWVRDVKKQKTMEQDWVFAGSRFSTFYGSKPSCSIEYPSPAKSI